MRTRMSASGSRLDTATESSVMLAGRRRIGVSLVGSAMGSLRSRGAMSGPCAPTEAAVFDHCSTPAAPCLIRSVCPLPRAAPQLSAAAPAHLEPDPQCVPPRARLRGDLVPLAADLVAGGALAAPDAFELSADLAAARRRSDDHDHDDEERRDHREDRPDHA